MITSFPIYYHFIRKHKYNSIQISIDIDYFDQQQLLIFDELQQVEEYQKSEESDCYNCPDVSQLVLEETVHEEDVVVEVDGAQIQHVRSDQQL